MPERFENAIAPIFVGMSEMKRRTFFVYNAIGAAIWAIGVSMAGYYLGEHIKNVDHYLLPIVALIVIVSLIPPALEYRKHRRNQNAAREADPSKK